MHSADDYNFNISITFVLFNTILSASGSQY